MKRKIYKSIAFLLTLCTLLPFAFSTTAYAITNQEAYYLSVLRPSNIKDIDQSYPVKLIVNEAVNSYDATENSKMSPTQPIRKRMEFTGYCGVSAKISDEDMLAILKDALSSVGSYKELQDPVDDNVLIQQTLEKLKVSQEDIDKMIENWQKLLGVDNVVSLLSGKVPDIAANDAINAVIDGAQGNIPGLPGMPGIGNVIDGAFISYEQWQKDKAKWKSIADMYEAKQRLRTYYAAVQDKINEYFSEHGNWTIKVNSQDWASLYYNYTYDNKQIWTADIELTKSDGSYGNITGTYTGKFEFKMDTDLSGFDNTFDDYLMKCLTVENFNMVGGFEAMVLGARNRSYEWDWSLLDWSGDPSEMLCRFEIPDCELNLSLPAGTNRAFFEIPVDSTLIYMTEYSRNINRTISVNGYSGDANRYTDETRTMNIRVVDDVETCSGTVSGTTYNAYSGTKTGSGRLEDEIDDDNTRSVVIDYAPDMVLIIDMLVD